MSNATSKVHQVLPDVLHISNFLDKDEQLSLFNVANSISLNYTATEFYNAQSHYVEILSIDLERENSKTATNIKVFQHFLEKVCPTISAHITQFPGKELFTYVTGYCYPKTGKLAAHCDNIPGWLIIVGLGSTANFWVRGPNSEDKAVFPFESGDIIAFCTSASASIQHGVDNIVPDSCPTYFPQEYHQKRISLQFRQTISTELVIPKHITLSSTSPSPLSIATTNTKPVLLPSNAPPKITINTTTMPTETNVPPFFGVPYDVVMHIFSFLGVCELEWASSTCRAYHQAPSLPPMWTHLYHSLLRNGDQEYEHKLEEYNKMQSDDDTEPGMRKFRIPYSFMSPHPSYHLFQPQLSTTTSRKLIQLLTTKPRDREYGGAVNIDFGSQNIRAGYSGDDLPHYVVRSLCGKDKVGTIFAGRDLKNISNYAVEIYKPIENRVVQNFEQLGYLWEHVLVDGLKVLPPDCNMLAQFDSVADKKMKEKATEMTFEQLGTCAWYITSNSVLALYSQGKTTGVTVDIGYANTTIAPIYEGYGLPEHIIHANIGGNHVTNELKKLVLQRYPDIQEKLGDCFESMKHKICYVDTKSKSQSEKSEVIYEGYLLDKERYEAAEIYFNPNLMPANEKTLAQRVAECIKSTSPDLHRDLCNNIVLCGGGCMLDGIGKRLEHELKLLTLSRFPIRVCAIDDKHRESSGWIGGSILASLSTFSKMWISRLEYEESGPSIVHRKCF